MMTEPRAEDIKLTAFPWTVYDEQIRTAIPTYTVRSPFGVLAQGVFIEDALMLRTAPELYRALWRLLDIVDDETAVQCNASVKSLLRDRVREAHRVLRAASGSALS